MPIATPEVYAEMLDKAKRESFAFPAINVSSSQTLNAALFLPKLYLTGPVLEEQFI